MKRYIRSSERVSPEGKPPRSLIGKLMKLSTDIENDAYYGIMFNIQPENIEKARTIANNAGYALYQDMNNTDWYSFVPD